MSVENIPKELTNEGFYFRFSPYSLILPSEAKIIPHLVNYLFFNQRIGAGYREIVKERQFVQNKLLETVINIPSIQQIAHDLSFSVAIRASAVMILLLHPNSQEKIENFKEALVNFYVPEVASWYIKSISSCLYFLTTDQNKTGRWIIGQLLSVTRTDFESREYLQSVLSLWRESSWAPVQGAEVQDKWLSGDG
jgi:hypothetical protein